MIRNDRFDVANSSLRAHGQGTVDYGTGALDLALTARLLEAPEGSVAGLSLDRIVGVDIPLTVRGSMSEPRVRPDVNRLLEAAARQQLRREGEEVEKKLKDKLEDNAQGPARAMTRAAALTGHRSRAAPCGGAGLVGAVARGEPAARASTGSRSSRASTRRSRMSRPC